MNKSYFTKAFLPAGFAFSLFASPLNFILTTPDSHSQIGKGTIEAGSGDSVQVQLSVNGKEFTGSGTMTPMPPKQIIGVRSDRAFMESKNMSRAKHGFATLSAKDGSPSSLACELYVRNEQVDGHCFDPADKQSTSIPVYPAHENQP
jgi:hypothetical protein